MFLKDVKPVFSKNLQFHHSDLCYNFHHEVSIKMSLKKYFQLVGTLLIISTVLFLFIQLIDILKSINMLTPKEIFMVILRFILIAFFTPALGMLFLAVANNLEDTKNLIITGGKTSENNNVQPNDSEHWYCECGNRIPNKINECHNCGKKKLT